MLKRFNNEIAKLIFEFSENSNTFKINEDEVVYRNLTLAIVPGSFKPPHKGHWEMVMSYVNNKDVNKVLVLISNISTNAISNRALSLSNLKKLAKIKEFVKSNNLNTDQLNEGFKEIDDEVESISYKRLEEIFTSKIIPSCIKNKNIDNNFVKLVDMINDYLKELKEKLFKSIRKAGNFEITPEVSQKIFKIFAKAYGVENKVDIQISNSASPITDTIGFINHKCIDCNILLGVSEKGGDDSRWNGIDRSIKNETVNVIPSPVSVKTMISATDLRNNISNLKKEYFPDKLSESDFNEIKKLLGNEE